MHFSDMILKWRFYKKLDINTKNIALSERLGLCSVSHNDFLDSQIFLITPGSSLVGSKGDYSPRWKINASFVIHKYVVVLF